MPVRICIADEHLLILSGIKSALAEAADIEVVGATHRGDELVELVERQDPDLVLLDFELSGVDGLACVRLIKERHPRVKVVMLSESEDAARISEAMRAGASAYIAKRIHPRDLASALQQVVDGVVYQVCPHVPAPELTVVEPEVQDSDLTKRELTMLEEISRGLSTKAISHELWITEKTVKFHLTNIYRKLGVSNRASAMRYAFDHDLIQTQTQTYEPAASAVA